MASQVSNTKPSPQDEGGVDVHFKNTVADVPDPSPLSMPPHDPAPLTQWITSDGRVLWQNVNWDYQDIEIAALVGRTRERVRQVRRSQSKPTAPNSGRRTLTLRTSLEALQILDPSLLDRPFPLVASLVGVPDGWYFRRLLREVRGPDAGIAADAGYEKIDDPEVSPVSDTNNRP